MSENTIFRVLLDSAIQAKGRAYAPYSNFRVGAALRTAGGAFHVGNNVENASFGLTMCAERSAIAQMIAGGSREISHLLVIGDTERFLPPCGACRQVIAEFAVPETVIWLCNVNGEARQTTINELLPYIFFLDRDKSPELQQAADTLQTFLPRL